MKTCRIADEFASDFYVLNCEDDFDDDYEDDDIIPDYDFDDDDIED